MRARSILGTCAVLAVTTGLLSPTAGVAQQVQQDTEAGRRSDITLRVENHSWLSMHVYVLTSAAPLRSLGLVSGTSSQVFHLPEAFAMAGTDLRVVADPVGDQGVYVSQTVYADPGTEIRVSLENTLPLSHTSVAPARD